MGKSMDLALVAANILAVRLLVDSSANITKTLEGTVER